ncbi:hypothetical protein [Rhizobium laguerreae]|uniref:hypothetical protein n=1 Tax=Rhizobium laguerreae TaxID=1076926 RepID=UPI001FEE07B4|nr:hypothetical protein [Rhizobium laguerreae]
MKLKDINLLGIDVGFSKSRPTTGIAWSTNGTFGAVKTHTDWERRRQHLPSITAFSVIAIDGHWYQRDRRIDLLEPANRCWPVVRFKSGASRGPATSAPGFN